MKILGSTVRIIGAFVFILCSVMFLLGLVDPMDMMSASLVFKFFCGIIGGILACILGNYLRNMKPN